MHASAHPYSQADQLPQAKMVSLLQAAKFRQMQLSLLELQIWSSAWRACCAVQRRMCCQRTHSIALLYSWWQDAERFTDSIQPNSPWPLRTKSYPLLDQHRGRQGFEQCRFAEGFCEALSGMMSEWCAPESISEWARLISLVWGHVYTFLDFATSPWDIERSCTWIAFTMSTLAHRIDVSKLDRTSIKGWQQTHISKIASRNWALACYFSLQRYFHLCKRALKLHSSALASHDGIAQKRRSQSLLGRQTLDSCGRQRHAMLVHGCSLSNPKPECKRHSLPLQCSSNLIECTLNTKPAWKFLSRSELVITNFLKMYELLIEECPLAHYYCKIARMSPGVRTIKTIVTESYAISIFYVCLILKLHTRWSTPDPCAVAWTCNCWILLAIVWAIQLYIGRVPACGSQLKLATSL